MNRINENISQNNRPEGDERENAEEMATTVTNDLREEYPGLRIEYKNKGLGGMYFFTVTCPGIISNNKNKETSIGIYELSEETLKREVKDTLNKWRGED